jgi:DNA-binding response OmpR family regulator
MARILCIDDEPSVVESNCAILQQAGHDATPAISVEQAIALMGSQGFDAVVTDWRVGDATCHVVVRAAKRSSSVPVVVVSGYVEQAYQAAEPLADLYLEKPVNPAELVIIVNELLQACVRSLLPRQSSGGTA